MAKRWCAWLRVLAAAMVTRAECQSPSSSRAPAAAQAPGALFRTIAGGAQAGRGSMGPSVGARKSGWGAT